MDETKNDVNGAKDSFNFHLSSCRVYIKFAFGEMTMRWGIFWRTLRFDLQKCTKVIQVGMLLHNFIVEMRQPRDSEDARFFQDFNIEMDLVQRELTRQTGEMPLPAVTDNNEPGSRGRRSAEDNAMRQAGIKIRQRLTVKLAAGEMKRPMQHHDMEYNKHGNIYLTS